VQALSLVAIGAGCVVAAGARAEARSARSDYVAILERVELLRRDNQILYYLVSIKTDQNNAERAKTMKRFNDFKKANGLP